MWAFKKEKQVVDLIKRHIAAIEACLVKSREALEHYISGRVGEATHSADEVDRIESEADGLVREIRDVLYSGAYLPGIRADIYRLVDMVDKIAGQTEEAARFLKCQSPDIPEEYQAEIMETFTISMACYHELQRAIKTFLKPKGKFEKLQERVSRVSVLESEADDKEMKVTTRIFSSELEYAHKLHLAAFVHLVASIADKAEDAAYELMFTALKSAI